MSPKVDDLEKVIGRPLRVGDVLLTNYGRDAYEITGLSEKPSGRIIKKIKRYVEYRELTDVGPGNVKYSTELNRDMWDDVIREEDRTDKPPLRER